MWSLFTSAAPAYGFGFHTNFYNGRENVLRVTRPIFPPRGWAGKSDAELMLAVCQRDVYDITANSGNNITGDIWVYPDGRMVIFADEGCNDLPPDLARALQIAIGNALVLHARLTGGGA
jgi:hypothetical protein